jgi:hypothetical protein
MRLKRIANWTSFMKSKTLAPAVRGLSLLLLVSSTYALAQESKPVPVYAEANTGEREEIVREFKLLLASYLSARLRA